jgi:hypothetical protein
MSRKVQNNTKKSKKNLTSRFDDGNGSFNSSKLCISDVGISETPSTTLVTVPLFASLLGATGQLITQPGLARPIMRGGTAGVAYAARVRMRKLLLKLNIIGSQGATLAIGDLFDRLRVILVKTKDEFGSTSSISIPPTIDNMLDIQDFDKVWLDKTVNLSSMAFNAADFNSPGLATLEYEFNMNDVFECFSSNGNTAWTTRNYDIRLLLVSDSTASPRPTVTGSARLMFEIA